MSPRRRTPDQNESSEQSDAREALERRWFRQLSPAPELRTLVTGADLRDEPLHRWLPYKQAFSPELVRRFLRDAGVLERTPVAVLDPFAGSGTTVIECARRGVPAVGVEAVRSLAFLARARGLEFTPVPRFEPTASLDELVERFEQPLHRAALLCAQMRVHASDGRPLQDAPPIGVVLRATLRMMRDDLADPPALPVDVRAGDARDLSEFEDGSVGGLLTSPPYLSRHNYERITHPAEALYARWYGTADERDAQIRAHPRSRGRAWADLRTGWKPIPHETGWKPIPHGDPRSRGRVWSDAPPPAVEECCEALRLAGAAKLAGVVRSYFDDMSAWLRETARVLAPGSPGWIVVGGARLRDVYIPSDLLLAEIAAARGLLVERLLEARRLIDAGRKLGSLEDVAPRETIIVIRGQ